MHKIPSYWYLLAVLPSLSHAFGSFGHRAIADMAQAKLSPKAKAELALILKAAPRSTLADMSVWPDEIRDDPINPRPETSRWHYINFPRGGCGKPIHKVCPDGQCVSPKLVAMLKVLANKKKPMAERAEALGFVVHFYGDLHQPLHVGFADDKGGNDFQISLPEGALPPMPPPPVLPNGQRMGINLHSLWDTQALLSRKLPDDQYQAWLMQQPIPKGYNLNASVEAITKESCLQVQAAGFYPSKHKVDQAYLDDARAKAEVRLILAGARLARALNKALK